MIQLQSYYKRVWKESMSGLGTIFDSNFRTRQRRATRYTSADSSTKALKELVQPRPTCCHQSILLQPSESLQDRIQWNVWCSLKNYCCRKPTRKGAQRLLGPCPHLPPLALQPPHTLFTPLKRKKKTCQMIIWAPDISKIIASFEIGFLLMYHRWGHLVQQHLSSD